jgi:hypothetical protein
MNDRSFERFFKLAWGAGCAVIILYFLFALGILGGLAWLAYHLVTTRGGL